MIIRRAYLTWICLALVGSIQGCTTSKSPLNGSQQLLVVCTNDWNQVQGNLQRFERKDLKSAWKPVGDVVNICVGKNGMGWGVGLHPHVDTAPQKKEGDIKAPAGVFKVSAIFSKSSDNDKTYKLPFIAIGPHTEVVDDTQSIHYNTIVEANKVTKDWKSSEKMYEIDLYDLGAVVDHNMPVKDKNAGSCIFLHRWREENLPNAGTAGCTSMAPEDLKVICQWLDSTKNPLIVQLPAQMYKQYMKDWQLPQVPFVQN